MPLVPRNRHDLHNFTDHEPSKRTCSVHGGARLAVVAMRNAQALAPVHHAGSALFAFLVASSARSRQKSGNFSIAIDTWATCLLPPVPSRCAGGGKCLAEWATGQLPPPSPERLGGHPTFPRPRARNPRRTGTACPPWSPRRRLRTRRRVRPTRKRPYRRHRSRCSTAPREGFHPLGRGQAQLAENRSRCRCRAGPAHRQHAEACLQLIQHRPHALVSDVPQHASCSIKVQDAPSLSRPEPRALAVGSNTDPGDPLIHVGCNDPQGGTMGRNNESLGITKRRHRTPRMEKKIDRVPASSAKTWLRTSPAEFGRTKPKVCRSHGNLCRTQPVFSRGHLSPTSERPKPGHKRAICMRLLVFSGVLLRVFRRGGRPTTAQATEPPKRAPASP